MRIRTLVPLAALSATLGLTAAATAGDQLAVVSITPARHALDAPLMTPVTISFDRAVDPATVSAATVRVMGRWSGPAPGTLALSAGDTVLTFTPDAPFSASEPVSVTLSSALAAADGAPMRGAGYAHSFRTRALPATMTFELIDTMTSELDGEFTRIYGALACDLDRDEWCDLALINEVTSDVRVLINTADGSGLFEEVLEPVNPTGPVPSPNEPADFNGDGFIDICTANTSGSTTTVLLGNGDGTFQPGTDFTCGSGPHGIAVLDADGDGDADIATANTGADNVAVLLNDGTGQFGPASTFDGGGTDEYGLAAADMNGDGVADLVVGTRASQLVTVFLGQGDGTFVGLPPVSAGGAVWMIVCGDVNGDGHMDVSCANSFSNNGAILLGDGTGALGAPTTVPAASQPIATDLGDLDGDGDLDWVLSSFNGSQWRVYVNDGTGSFTLGQTFDAVSNPACAVLVDFDNDRDLDIVTLDEIADLVQLRRNSSVPVNPDVNLDGSVNVTDLLAVLAGWGDCPAPCPPSCPADANGDCTVDVTDLLAVLGGWS